MEENVRSVSVIELSLRNVATMLMALGDNLFLIKGIIGLSYWWISNLYLNF